MTDYSFGKTYRLKDGYTALNGCVQYYTITVAADLTVECPKEDDADFETKLEAYKKSQANFLRILETLRTAGGQPIITEVKAGEDEGTSELKFTLEQANVYGMGIKDGGEEQVSAKWDAGKVNEFVTEAKTKIKALFEHLTDVDGNSLALEDADIVVDRVLF